MAKVELDSELDIISIYLYKIAIINLVAIVKFFYIICKTILLSLFTIEHYDKGLLKAVLKYFRIVKINYYNIYYLYYLIWLKKISYLPTLYAKIYKNKDFYMKLLVFLKYIIKCFTKNHFLFNTLHYSCFNICKINITKDFIAQFKKNNKEIAKKVWMHFLIYYLTYYKYNTNQSKVYRFDFLRSKILPSYINYIKLI